MEEPLERDDMNIPVRFPKEIKLMNERRVMIHYRIRNLVSRRHILFFVVDTPRKLVWNNNMPRTSHAIAARRLG